MGRQILTIAVKENENGLGFLVRALVMEIQAWIDKPWVVGKETSSGVTPRCSWISAGITNSCFDG